MSFEKPEIGYKWEILIGKRNRKRENGKRENLVSVVKVVLTFNLNFCFYIYIIFCHSLTFYIFIYYIVYLLSRSHSIYPIYLCQSIVLRHQIYHNGIPTSNYVLSYVSNFKIITEYGIRCARYNIFVEKFYIL